MRAWIFSDLHLEYGKAGHGLDVPDADICLCAGNLLERGVAPSVDWLGQNVAPIMPVVFVPGNHEYYHSSIKEGFDAGLMAAREYKNLYMIDQGFVIVGGVRFVGATLWTDFSLFGDPRLPMLEAAEQIGDYRKIKISKNPLKRFSPRQATGLHFNARIVLESMLAAQPDCPTVVITHHAPSLLSMSQDWVDNPLAPSFASNLERLVMRHQPEFWIHGHVHNNADYMIYNTRVICNPRGYPSRNPEFDASLVVDLVNISQQRNPKTGTRVCGAVMPIASQGHDKEFAFGFQLSSGGFTRP